MWPLGDQRQDLGLAPADRQRPAQPVGIRRRVVALGDQDRVLLDPRQEAQPQPRGRLA